MSEIVREMTRGELVAVNNKLRAENEELKAKLEATRMAVRHVAEENQLKYEFTLSQWCYLQHEICT